MKNREAARYARWSAGAAIAIGLLVIAVYVQRRMRGGAQGRNLHPVPAAVAQQSAEFTFSKTVGRQKLFTVHASRATQFKDQNRSLLENVAITIYGTRGQRDDSVRADECSYLPQSGSIRCQGVVQISLRNAKAKNREGSGEGMNLQTSDILFDRDSGKVTTDKSVSLQFAGGEGQADGVSYDPQSENVTLEKNVRLQIAPSAKSREAPVKLTGSSLEFRRSENAMRIFGPIRVVRNASVLTAGLLELQFDAALRPARAVATGSPAIVTSNSRGAQAVFADSLDAEFTAAGAVAKIIAERNVHGESQNRDAATRFSAGRAELDMDGLHSRNEPLLLSISGNVRMETARGPVKRSLATEAMQVDFAPSENGRGQRIASAETLAPGEIASAEPQESVRLRAARFRATFGARDNLAALRGSGNVELTRTPAGKSSQTSSARDLFAEFASSGVWQTVRESGDVKFSEGDRRARANDAELSSATNEITLSGAASVENSSSRLQAVAIHINQSTGEVHAKGSVVASYSGKPNAGVNFAADPANISADEMNGAGFIKSQSSNVHTVFSGNARMWQGTNFLQARAIELWQDGRHAQARGDVTGQFVETPQRFSSPPRSKSRDAAPVLWQVKAPQGDYWNDSGKVEWSGGVQAQSSEGSISSQTLDLLFSRETGNRQTLQRAVATGGVRIEQNGRTGTAERGEYVASEGKFVLSGGQPTLADSSGNTTTGRQLTFFLANDSILVDSQNGPRSKRQR